MYWQYVDSFCSILEYLSRDDADRACKELDNTELRGRPVRVTLDDSVFLFLIIALIHAQVVFSAVL